MPVELAHVNLLLTWPACRASNLHHYQNLSIAGSAATSARFCNCRLSLIFTLCRANGSHLTLVHYMRKALAAADPTIMADIDALKDIVSLAVKSSVGHLSDSLRSCDAAVSFADSFLMQLRQSPDDSEGRFLHHAQHFLEAAQHQASTAKAAVANAMESTKTMMDFFGINVKPAKVGFFSDFCSSLFFVFVNELYVTRFGFAVVIVFSFLFDMKETLMFWKRLELKMKISLHSPHLCTHGLLLKKKLQD